MYYKYKNLKIYYEEYLNPNSNKNIVILPGWGEVRNTFYKMIIYLTDYFNVYIIDYPSFGNSPLPDKELNIFDYAELIKNFCIDLKLDNLYIIAHSFGGRIAILLTSIYNLNVEKQILIDVAGIKPRKTIYKFIKEKTYKLLKLFIDKLFRKNKERLLRKLRCFFGSADYSKLNGKMITTFKNIVNTDLKKYYDNINTKTLIIWGKKDIDTPLKDAVYINKHINDSELIIFDRGTHFVYLEYSDAINLIIKEYIES